MGVQCIHIHVREISTRSLTVVIFIPYFPFLRSWLGSARCVCGRWDGRTALRFFWTYVGLIRGNFGARPRTYLPTYLPAAASGRKKTYLPIKITAFTI